MQIADFVKEQRPRVREFEAADAPVRRPGKRAPLVAEHLALHEIARNRGAVHPHERTLAARTRDVQPRRDQLLAGAGFPSDQYAGIGRTDARDECAHVAHHWRVTDHLAGDAEIFAQRLCRATGLTQLERGRQREQYAFRRQRLLEEREGAEFGRAHRIGQRRASAHHDDGQIRASLAELGQQRESVQVTRHHQVDQRDIRFDGEGQCETRRTVGRVAHVVPFGAQQRADHPPDVRLVINDQYAGHAPSVAVRGASL